MAEPIVTYQDVHKSFGNVEVLKGIDLDIYPAEKSLSLVQADQGKQQLSGC